MPQYNDNTFKKKYGTSFSDIKTESKTYSRVHILYLLFYMLRRMLYIIIIFSLSGYICVQICLALLIAALMIWYKVTYKPFNSKYRNRCKIYNEVIIFLATENLIFFTDYMLSWDQHWGAGWIFIIIISTFLLLHVLIMLWDALLWLYLLYLRYSSHP